MTFGTVIKGAIATAADPFAADAGIAQSGGIVSCALPGRMRYLKRTEHRR